MKKNQKLIEVPANIPLPPPLFKNDEPKSELALPPIDTSALLERDTTPLPFKIPTFLEPEPHRVLPLKTATFRELEATSVLITSNSDVTHTSNSMVDTIEAVDKRNLKKVNTEEISKPPPIPNDPMSLLQRVISIRFPRATSPSPNPNLLDSNEPERLKEEWD